MSHKNSPLDPAGLTGASRRQFLKYTSVLGAAAGVAATVSACGPSSGTSGNGGGGGKGGSSTISATLAFQLSGTLDPDNHSSAVATAANQHVFEALVDLDPASREPYLALAKAQPKASSDGLKWTVELRDGAKFSDGSAVTGEDVAWSFTRSMDPAVLMSQFISFIKSVKATGKTSVEFTLKEPFPLFPTRISVIKIVPKAHTKTAAQAKKFGDQPIGSGPWVLDSADPNSGLTFSVNKHYNGKYKAKATKMVWHTTTQDSTRIADLQSGRSQTIEAVPFVNVKQLKKTKKVEAKQAFNQIFLMFNCSAKPFDDKRVRQALHYAIDTDAIVRTAFQGYASAAQSYLDEGNADFQKASTVYNHDPAKAKKLLAEAGASNLSIELVTTDAGAVASTAPLIIDAWKKVGVTAKLNTAPSASVYAPAPDGLITKPNFRVLLASGDPTVYGADVDLLMRWFYYGATWPVDRFHWQKASAKKVADWLDEAAKESDEAKQKALWQKAIDFVADEAPLYPVVHTKMVTGWDDKKLTDFEPVATTGLYFLKAKPA
ncbi:ABC transporter substrate-binding protein [Flexivirga endophytica]|uniref:ABC transporter substrate-binding protein n=1 Tax=Flexivirga endophytica TaxID=1849103 RepID=A0A916TGW7_9MICO|nr:ABC transporter substrate-binding protein [Flexivirga endophytica]GGB44255.1 ABC transporter substrate-binding protein [Flexivirga endophytica]GHB60168.1 ABC transporter substrate-binding protein [Flexivirga endophytica]